MSMSRPKVVVDGNEAAAHVAHKVSEVIAIYPITPSSPMGEWSDEWSAQGRKNLWGTVPQVTEMQSEGGAAGAVHGALQAGALTTTFTASQGLLLMIPNLFKIAGELTPAVLHVTARTVATHALSIFGDHGDVMACRGTGMGMLASCSVQEVMDLALIAHAATLEARVPFIHFFDGFRTSHEVAKIEQLTDDDIRALVSDELVAAHRARALNPEHPVVRGTAQNPDVFFQAREASNPYYAACPEIVQRAMDTFAKVVGRKYHLFDYEGAPDAERVVILMGSGAETAHETVDYLTSQGEKVGVLKVRLYRPFSAEHFLRALPATVKAVAVLDRTKEPGADGEPLYLDVVAALRNAHLDIPVIGGRYGLSSKEFTPAMVKAVFDELRAACPKRRFTVGIVDDVTHLSLAVDESFSTEDPKTTRCLFFGLGADGTVGANKNSIKIIGDDTENYAQGYFVYDSKKSGGITVSHLRFGPNVIRAPYLINRANFVACHQFSFIERLDMLRNAAPGSVFLLNSVYGAEEVWNKLPRITQKRILDKKIRFYVIDAYKVAHETGMGGRINSIMQTCFFAISGVLPREEAIESIKKSIKKTYGKKGDAVVQQNFASVDAALANLFEVKNPGQVTSTFDLLPPVPAEAPDFVRKTEGPMIVLEGDDLPVSALPADGTFPSGTTQWEKRNIAMECPSWDPAVCIQCGKCSLVCPHAVIRAKVYDPALLAGAPETFKSTDAKFKQFEGMKYTLQVSVEDCTGCGLCVQNCPAKSKTEEGKKAINMVSQMPLQKTESANWKFFLSLPEADKSKLNPSMVKDLALYRPLFEFSGACAGCGETPYVKLVSALFGDRAMVANATGCSSIYGGNLPTTPWTKNAEGRGPAWANSLFEDNAEFGMGMRLAVDQQQSFAQELLGRLEGKLCGSLVKDLLAADQSTDAGIAAQRERVVQLRECLKNLPDADARALEGVADALVRRSVWIIGGDGWAYDIGYGGLDHVMASGRNVNILVLDTEVYSNTGGQMSKSTPMGAVAKFAASGKPRGKKDLAMMAMSYGNVYVARVSLGANDAQTVKAFREAEAYDGPSLIIAYSHCIAHGIDMSQGLEQQKKAVASGHWILMRYDPRRTLEGQNPLQIDSKEPSLPLGDYVYAENRYNILQRAHPEESKALVDCAQEIVKSNWRLYQHMASMNFEKK